MASAGPSPLRAAAFLLIPLLTFSLGYLLGGAQSTPTGEAPSNEYEQEILRLVRALPDELRASTPVTISESLRSSFANAGSNEGSGMRLPALDAWLQRIDDAVVRLEQAASRTAAIAPRSKKEILQLASDPKLPRKDAQLKSFILEYEKVEYSDYETDEDWDAAWGKLTNEYRFLSMEDVLNRFGRPDEIQVDAGTSYWEYYEDSDDQYGNPQEWGVSLNFYDGMLIEFGGYWTRER